MKRIWIYSLISLFLFNEAQAFPCYVTIAKDSCWTNYNVNVDVTDANTGKKIMTVIIPQGQSWVRQPFTCQVGETLSLQATFNPVIWETDADKVYAGHHYWGLPKNIQQGQAGWNVSVCFAKDFAEVPLPPEGNGKCSCDFNSIPKIERIKVKS